MRKILKALAFAALTLLLFIVTPKAVGAHESLTEINAEQAYTVSMSGGLYTIDGRQSADISSLISEVATTGAILFFDGVTVDEPLIISSNVTVSGSITLARGAVIDGGEITFRDAEVYIKNGSVRIKNGRAVMLSGRIESRESAIVLDYSASSSFCMSGGEIYSTCNLGSLRLSLGAAIISGGSITNGASFAIYNSAELTVCANALVSGVPYDIETRTPIRLSDNGSYYSAPLAVKYPAYFREGSFTKVFLSATVDQVADIKLFDADMKPLEITYFESSKNTDERSFIAVSLPFKAVFRSGGEVIGVEEFYSGQIPDALCPDIKEGYVFDGWYTDMDRTDPYNFSSPPNKSIDLYADIDLMPPSFEISSIDLEYDGQIHRLAFSSVSHPLSHQGTFSYDWYKNGEALNISSPYLDFIACSESGYYNCKLTFIYNGDFITVSTPEILVSIRKKQIEIPSLDPLEYTSERLYASVGENPFYSLYCEGGVDVGEYTATLVLNDPENTGWAGSEEYRILAPFTIVRACNKFLSVSAKDIYEGSSPEVSASLKFGEFVVYYSSDGKSFSTDIPTHPGKYYAKCISAQTDNYTAAESQTVSFEILKLECIGIRIERLPDKTEYLPFEIPELEGLSLIATYNNGSTVPVDLSEVSVAFRNGSYLSGADTAVMLSYASQSVPMPLKVGKTEYDTSGIYITDKTAIYSGSFHSIIPDISVTGLDGSELQCMVTGGGVDVGIYPVTISFYTDSPSYKVPDPVTVSLNIEPMPISVEYGDLEFIYSGTPQVPSAVYMNAFGAYVSIVLDGAQVNAGKYTASVPSDLSNYTVSNPEITYEILKANIDASEFTWSENKLVYSAAVQKVELVGMPAGVRVIGYIDSSATDAGEYTAIAKISYDERNFNAPPEISLDWSISRASYDMDSFLFTDTEAVYDGRAHYPALMGELPVGADGIRLEYTFSAFAESVSDGTVTVRIDFTSESANYVIPDSLYATVRILPAAIEVDWQGQAFIYDGNLHLPAASSDKCEISVSGAGKDAGEYVARAVSLDPNFEISNAEYVFTVHKTENEWLIYPSITDIYTSGSLSPIASAKYGDVKFSYFLDSALVHSIDIPSASGVYYLRASVKEGDNYLPLTSEAIRFEIIAVMPMELTVDVTKEQTAMSGLSADTSIILINNDGSVRELSHSEVEIIYQSADSFRYSDSFVTVAYGELLATASVKVVKAQYDTSGVKWINTHHVYDGSAKFPILTGLPDGVEVISYIGTGAADAGNYPLGATLSYDNENYHEPAIPVATLVIEKQKISLPSPQAVIYDGAYHSPLIEKSPMYSAVIPSEKSAGKYRIQIILTDPDNYELSEDIYFEIAPRELTVKVMSDGKSYSIVTGSLLISDALAEEYYTEGGLVYLRSNNPNYKVTVIPSSSAASSNRIWLGIIVFLSVALISLTVIIVIKYPDRLRAAADALKRKMRSPVAALATSPSFKTILAADRAYADGMISDVTAKTLLTKSKERVFTEGDEFATVSIGAIAEKFAEGDIVDVNAMKSADLLPATARRVRISAEGVIDKPLTVKAGAFDLSAVKMIALTGGSAVRVRETRKKLPPS